MSPHVSATEEELDEHALSSAACGTTRGSLRARTARLSGVPQGYSTAPQGFAPGYAPVPQRPVTRKVNWVSIILGVVGWTLIGLTVLAMWMALRASASDPDPSGKDIIGFFPLFAMIFIGPVNLAGGIIGIVGATGTPKVRKLNWLGILLNASPYVMFVVLMLALMLFA